LEHTNVVLIYAAEFPQSLPAAAIPQVPKSEEQPGRAPPKQKIYMPRYRVLTISAVGDIVRARHFIAANDTEAIERATADREALLRIELWKGSQLVHTIKAGPTKASR
jgi:hypothetical protein